jgi:hypothetical protein
MMTNLILMPHKAQLLPEVQWMAASHKLQAHMQQQGVQLQARCLLQKCKAAAAQGHKM